ncbi:retrovirus-related Pol polyprotein from transposon 412 [Trichonephila clavipes]|nr:retrovirus-related Pol polyprotein from transposon 412 [Trichonephila clavipes]
MKARLQKTAESLQEYASEIERIANLGFSDYPTTVQEIITLKYFMHGLKDGEIERAIRISSITTPHDQGRNFDSVVCKRLCEILGIDKTWTKALHPQFDRILDRFNRTILNSMSLPVSRNQQDWDKKLPLFMLAYRSVVHESTGYSPSKMLFGRDIGQPDTKCSLGA